jgi:hypothetical protein
VTVSRTFTPNRVGHNRIVIDDIAPGLSYDFRCTFEDWDSSPLNSNGTYGQSLGLKDFTGASAFKAVFAPFTSNSEAGAAIVTVDGYLAGEPDEGRVRFPMTQGQTLLLSLSGHRVGFVGLHWRTAGSSTTAAWLLLETGRWHTRSYPTGWS